MKPEYIFTTITILIGVFVAYTAYNQYRLSKEKFKLDMFDKRYGVYKNTQVFLTKILRDAKIEMEDIFEYRANTQDSVFLFKDDIPNYLQEIDKKAFERLDEKYEHVFAMLATMERKVESFCNVR